MEKPEPISLELDMVLRKLKGEYLEPVLEEQILELEPSVKLYKTTPVELTKNYS